MQEGTKEVKACNQQTAGAKIGPGTHRLPDLTDYA
jgi:hypothetical protein